MRAEMEEDMIGGKGLAEEFLQCPPEVMRYALTFIDKKYGSIAQYLVHIGVSLPLQQRIRELILEPRSVSD